MNMLIIIAVVLLVVATVYIQIRRSKKNEKSCGCDCCSSSCAEKASNEKPVEASKKLVLDIEGMHCVRCQNGVSEALNSLDGVSATVDLEKNCAFVELSKDVPENELKEAVADKGFTVAAVKIV